MPAATDTTSFATSPNTTERTPPTTETTTLLETIQSGRQSKPPRVLLYGVEGIGKSTFGSEAPKPIFIQTEDGLDEIDCDRFPLATKFDDVVAALKTLRDQKHDYESAVIDSLDWLERLVWDKLCQQYGVESIEKVDGGYARGYMHALSLWREVLDLLGVLRARGMVIVLIAHSKVERFEDPESSPYDRYSPRLHKHASALICEWSDAVLFATRRLRTQSEETGFNRKRTIAHAIGKEGGERVIRAYGSPTCVAKNRYGIGEELPLSWPAFVGAIANH
ncbi:MAG: ATP-binding protein [Planctomycetota bacterium]